MIKIFKVKCNIAVISVYAFYVPLDLIWNLQAITYFAH